MYVNRESIAIVNPEEIREFRKAIREQLRKRERTFIRDQRLRKLCARFSRFLPLLAWLSALSYAIPLLLLFVAGGDISGVAGYVVLKALLMCVFR